MTKQNRLLRSTALILIVRDEFEEKNIHLDWCDSATEYIDLLTGKDQQINDEYEMVFNHVDKLIRIKFDPAEVCNELFVIMRKDLNKLKVTNKIVDATNKIEIAEFDVKKVKLIDSVVNLIEEK